MGSRNLPGFRTQIFLVILMTGVAALTFWPKQAAAIPYGTIAGNVTGAGGNPLDRICVNAYAPNGSLEANSAVTDDDGNYVIQLDAGSYRLNFRPCAPGADNNFASEFYDDSETLAGATAVSVTAGLETPGVNAELAPGGSVSGTVTDTNGFPLPSLCIQAFDTNGNERAFGFVSGGQYVIHGLVNGSYRLKFSDCFHLYDFTVTPEYYADKATLAEATAVSVTVGSDTPGINAQLEAPDRDITAPDTLIDSGPSGVITENQATFHFRSSDPDDTTKLQCRIDSGPFETCTSPKTYVSLGEGPHTVFFWAQDSSGNQDQTPATRTFTVDTTLYKAMISGVSVKGPVKVRKGRKATYRVVVTNSGNAEATGVRLSVKGRGVRFDTPVAEIPAGAARTLKVNLKPKRAGKAKLTFRVTSSNAGSKSIARNIRVIKP